MREKLFSHRALYQEFFNLHNVGTQIGKLIPTVFTQHKNTIFPINCWDRMPLETHLLRREDSRSADNHILLGNQSVLSLHIEFMTEIYISKMKASRINVITFKSCTELQTTSYPCRPLYVWFDILWTQITSMFSALWNINTYQRQWL